MALRAERKAQERAATDHSYALFKASAGWIQDTLERNNYGRITLHGTGGDIDQAAAATQMEQFRAHLASLKIKKILKRFST